MGCHRVGDAMVYVCRYCNWNYITGIVTCVYLNGIIDPSVIRPNDILRIDSEQFKVLNLDPVSGRIRVLRGHNNTLQVNT